MSAVICRRDESLTTTAISLSALPSALVAAGGGANGFTNDAFDEFEGGPGNGRSRHLDSAVNVNPNRNSFHILEVSDESPVRLYCPQPLMLVDCTESTNAELAARRQGGQTSSQFTTIDESGKQAIVPVHRASGCKTKKPEKEPELTRHFCVGARYEALKLATRK